MYAHTRRSRTAPPKNSQGSQRTSRQGLRYEDSGEDSLLAGSYGWSSGRWGYSKISNTLKIMHEFISNKWVVYANLTIITLGLLLYGYWYFLDGTVVGKVLDNQTFINYQTNKTEYHQGEEVAVASQLCKYRQVPATVMTFLTDTISLPYPVKTNNLPPKCRTGKEMIIMATIPSIAPAGSYHLDGSFTYEVNPVRSITVPFKTNEFSIVDYEGFIK